MAKANCNWWQYSRWIYNVGRTSRYLEYSDGEKEAIITFITSIMESRVALVPRIRLKYLNPVDDLTKQNYMSLGMILQLIGRNLKVEAPTEAEKEACDVLLAATGDRKYRRVGMMARISATITPEGAGVVNGVGSYAIGATVTLKAVPNHGYAFDKWTDTESTDTSREVEVEEDLELGAEFEALDERTITISANDDTMGNAFVYNPAGQDKFYDGDQIILMADPAEGYAFVKWEDDSTQALRNVTIDGDATYTATFAAAAEQL